MIRELEISINNIEIIQILGIKINKIHTLFKNSLKSKKYEKWTPVKLMGKGLTNLKVRKNRV